jgi:hypothetical protein
MAKKYQAEYVNLEGDRAVYGAYSTRAEARRALSTMLGRGYEICIRDTQSRKVVYSKSPEHA